MTIRSNVKFSPELLITAPRRSPATPSSDGKFALFTVSTYSLDTHKETKEIKVINLETEDVQLFSNDAADHSPQWLDQDQILWLKNGDKGKTEVWVGTADTNARNTYRAGVIDAAITNVKIKGLPDGTIAFVFSALASEDGSLYNAETAEKPLSSAREYDTIFVRFWDSYYTKERSTLWYTTLEKADHSLNYKLVETRIVNALENTTMHFPSGPADTNNLGGSFDLSDDGILLVTRDPEVDSAKKLTLGIWYLSISSYRSPPQALQQIKVPDFDGMCSSPSFSQDGGAASFLSTKSEAEGPDYNRIFVIKDVKESKVVTQILPIRDEKIGDSWDLSPNSIIWSNDNTELYAIVEEKARRKIWQIPVMKLFDEFSSDMKKLAVVAVPFSSDKGSISSVHHLSKEPSESRLLVNKTSFVNDGMFYITDPKTKVDDIFPHMNYNELNLGLHRSQVSEIYFQGAGENQVQAWVLKPSNFDKSKKYPLAFLIHGGPAGTWPDSWSTRWNPMIWAEQGYVVVSPNPTGSTSFGIDFAAAIQGEWGGRCYGDLVKCFEYVENNMPFVDTSRAFAAGGSFGGYMINWIAGQPLAKKFKTLICHDGVFSNYNMLSSDVPVALDEDMGSHLWDSKATWDKYDPAQFTHNWTTPMLFIHSDKDFRCPITEGLAPYHVCQMRGIPSRFLNFPDENHFVLQRENSLRWYKTVLGWANKYTGVDGVRLEPALTEPRRAEHQAKHLY